MTRLYIYIYICKNIIINVDGGCAVAYIYIYIVCFVFVHFVKHGDTNKNAIKKKKRNSQRIHRLVHNHHLQNVQLHHIQLIQKR